MSLANWSLRNIFGWFVPKESTKKLKNPWNRLFLANKDVFLKNLPKKKKKWNIANMWYLGYEIPRQKNFLG